MDRSRCAVLAVAVACFFVFAVPAQAADGWSWPLQQEHVATSFDAPETAYGPGHRGVDIPGTPGESVRSVAAGTVAFVGVVAGVPVVTVNHGSERATYQPVKAAVRKGDAVTRGQVLGQLATTGAHCLPTCLHLGRIAGETYLDPAELLRSRGRIKLVDPDGPVPVPPRTSSGALHVPVAGPVTSAFGMRVHPITGVRKLHDGTDIGAPCRTPVKAAAPGVVKSAAWAGAYGNRVVITHPDGLETWYAHLSNIRVSAGQRVGSSSVVGEVGQTGSATGCHLHFTVIDEGKPVNPMPLL